MLPSISPQISIKDISAEIDVIVPYYTWFDGVIIAPILYPHVLGPCAPMLNAFTIGNMTEIENRRFYLFFSYFNRTTLC